MKAVALVPVLIALISLIVPASAQSLQSIVKGALRDTLTGTAGELATGANIDPREEDDSRKMYWDNTTFTPFTLDGYRLFRNGSSGVSKYRGGVKGWHNCDAHLPEGSQLAAAAHTHPGGINYRSGGGYGYALGMYGHRGEMRGYWGQGGDMRTAYNLKISIAAYSSAGADYWSYSKYVDLQAATKGPVPLCMGATSGCGSY